MIQEIKNKMISLHEMRIGNKVFEVFREFPGFVIKLDKYISNYGSRFKEIFKEDSNWGLMLEYIQKCIDPHAQILQDQKKFIKNDKIILETIYPTIYEERYKKEKSCDDGDEESSKKKRKKRDYDDGDEEPSKKKKKRFR